MWWVPTLEVAASPTAKPGHYSSVFLLFLECFPPRRTSWFLSRWNHGPVDPVPGRFSSIPPLPPWKHVHFALRWIRVILLVQHATSQRGPRSRVVVQTKWSPPPMSLRPCHGRSETFQTLPGSLVHSGGGKHTARECHKPHLPKRQKNHLQHKLFFHSGLGLGIGEQLGSNR